MDFVDNPKTVFSFTKRGNRASVQKVAGSNAESEKAAQQALDIITSLDYTTTLLTPKEATASGIYCLAGMYLLREGLTLTEGEEKMYRSALEILQGRRPERDEDSEDDSDSEVELI